MILRFNLVHISWLKISLRKSLTRNSELKKLTKSILCLGDKLTLLSRDVCQLKVGLQVQTWKSHIMVDEGRTDEKVPLDVPISQPDDHKKKTLSLIALW